MFERLTWRDSKGVSNAALGERPSALSFTGITADRLAAYEDTGLTPNEIKQLKAENDHLKAQLGKAINALECVTIKGENW